MNANDLLYIVAGVLWFYFGPREKLLKWGGTMAIFMMGNMKRRRIAEEARQKLLYPD